METTKLFLIKSSNRQAKLYLSNDNDIQTVNLLFASKQLIFFVHSQEYTNEFFENISEDWIEFVLESTSSFLLDENNMMDEYVLHLN